MKSRLFAARREAIAPRRGRRPERLWIGPEMGTTGALESSTIGGRAVSLSREVGEPPFVARRRRCKPHGGVRQARNAELDPFVKNVITVITGMARKTNPDIGSARFLTTREAAERLGVTVNSIKAWVREERLPALKTPGGHHRISEADLVEFQKHLSDASRTPVVSRPRILVVDDDDALLATLRETLQDVIPDSIVQTAADGYEALVEVGAFRPDVLVIDIRMPRLDGFEVCRRLKQRKESAATRILAVTAHPEEELRAKALESGADDFLEKPFAIERFRSRVVALLTKDGRR